MPQAQELGRTVRRRLLPPAAAAPFLVAAAAAAIVERHPALLWPVAAAAGLLLAGLVAWAVLWAARHVEEDARARAQVSEEMRASHEHYVLAVRGSSDGLWDWDVVTNKVYFSPRWKSMLGYEDADLANDFSTWESLLHPDERAASLAKVRDYHDGRIPFYELEHRLLCKDGSYRWILARGAVLRDAAGRPVRMSGSHTDIHDRKRAEEALRESEERFRQVAENIREVFWLSNVEKNAVIYVSPGYETNWGRPRKELYANPQSWADAIHPEDRERVWRAATTKQASGTYDEVYRIRRADGELRWIRDRAFPVKDSSGKVYRIAGLAEDITDRRRAEDALRESEERFRQVAENIRDAFWLADATGDEVHYMSRAWERIWGRPLPPLSELARVWAGALHPEDRERVLAAGDARHEGPYENRYRILRPDGSVRWVMDRVVPVRDADGRAFRVAGVSEDITEQHELERKLLEARDQALASAEAKSRFLANVGHELRTPLHAIQGMCELMMSSGVPAPFGDRAKVAHDAVTTLGAIVDDLLDLSKAEAGRVTLAPAPTDPRAPLTEAAALLRDMAGKKGLSLELHLDATLPPSVLADALRLRQVVVNLLSNAVKFTHEGGVTLEAWAEPAAPGNIGLRVAVSDTGIGIAPEAHGRIFEHFTQADESTTRRFGGTGLGLAIARHLVELMGGEIGLDSEPGRGASFWFRVELPLAGATASAPASRPAPPAPGARVLVVEDNAVNRRVTGDLLESLGAAPSFAEDGAAALGALRPGAFDLVLMDCAMPVMDGYAATRELRRREGTGPRVPVVALTANASDEDRRRCLEAGMDGYLRKPVRLSELAETLGRWASPVDPSVLAKAEALAGANASRVKRDFLADSRRLLAEIPTAAAAGRAEDARRAAHTLKGAAAALGARRLSELAAALEAEPGSAALAAEAARELERVAAALG